MTILEGMDINEAAAQAMGGIEMPLTDSLSFSPTLQAWNRGAPKRQQQRPTAPTFARQTNWVPGDEKADKIARDNGVDPVPDSGWLSIAKSQLGAPYVWATSNPKGAVGGAGSGFDCSGYTQWLYKRAFGVSLPHFSQAQAQMSQKVGKEGLQPGDLLFFSYGRLGSGAIDDVQIYAGNGQMIGASSGENAISVRPVNWDNFVQGGRIKGASPGGAATSGGKSSPVSHKVRGNVAPEIVPNATYAAAGIGMDLYLSSPAAVAAHMAANASRDATKPKQNFGTGTKAEIKQQLYDGFMDAGRADLARMVRTKDFDTWISAESGWTVDSVSKYYEGHGRNYGLFQFWDGHSWTDQYYRGGDWTMSAYDQAKMVVRYFNLTPQDIRTYAGQIRSHEYSGWG